MMALWIGLAVAGCEETESPSDTAEPLFELRELTVPADESGEGDETIAMRYLWLNETGVDDPPVLVFLFGGPGSSAVEFLAFVSTFVPEWVIERFALVGLDDVGVGASAPIFCSGLGSSQDEAYLHPFVPSTTEALQQVWQESTAACRAGYPYADLINTERHARDLERLRVELGARQLNFMAYSYGTRAALAYAALYTERTGRIVLDSPVDPRGTYLDQLRDQALARESALLSFLDACEGAGDCGFSRQAFLQAMGDLENKPASFAIEFLVILEDLTFQPQWPAAAATLASVLADFDNAPRLLTSNATILVNPAFIGTLCADAPIAAASDIEESQAALATSIDTVLPSTYFSDVFNAAHACLHWPGAETTIDWNRFFAGPALDVDMLMVNSTGDTKSPASFAESLGNSISGLARVRIDEVSHAVGLQGVNECVDGTIRAFLAGDDVSGTLDCPPSAF